MAAAKAMNMTMEEMEREIEDLSNELWGQLPSSPKSMIPDPLQQLNDEQLDMIRQFRYQILKNSSLSSHLSEDEVNFRDENQGDLTPDSWKLDEYLQMDHTIESMVLNRVTYMRFLVGFDWNLRVAVEKLRSMIRWRCQVEQPQNYTVKRSIRTHIVKTRFLQLYGYDRMSRPIIYVNLSRLNMEIAPSDDDDGDDDGGDNGTESPPSSKGKSPVLSWDSPESMSLKIKLFLYMLERACERMERIHATNVYQVIWIIDMDQSPVGLGLVKQMKDLFLEMADYYPDRLHSALLFNTSWTVNIMWSFVKMFLEERIIQKYKFVKKGNDAELVKWIDDMVDRECLLDHVGGQVCGESVFDVGKMYRLDELNTRLGELRQQQQQQHHRSSEAL